MTDKERCDLLLEQIRTLKEAAEAWKKACLAAEARLAEMTRHERMLAESRGKRDLEAMGDGE